MGKMKKMVSAVVLMVIVFGTLLSYCEPAKAGDSSWLTDDVEDSVTVNGYNIESFENPNGTQYGIRGNLYLNVNSIPGDNDSTENANLYLRIEQNGNYISASNPSVTNNYCPDGMKTDIVVAATIYSEFYLSDVNSPINIEIGWNCGQNYNDANPKFVVAKTISIMPSEFFPLNKRCVNGSNLIETTQMDAQKLESQQFKTFTGRINITDITKTVSEQVDEAGIVLVDPNMCINYIEGHINKRGTDFYTGWGDDGYISATLDTVLEDEGTYTYYAYMKYNGKYYYGTEYQFNNIYSVEKMDDYIYNSDVYNGYSKILSSGHMMIKYENVLASTLANVQSEYSASGNFLWSSIIEGVSIGTDAEDVINYFKDKAADKQVIDATETFVEGLVNTDYSLIDDAEMNLKYIEKAKSVASFAKDFEEVRLKFGEGADVELYKDYTEWTVAHLQEYLTKISSSDMTTLKTKWYTFLSQNDTILDGTVKAFEFAEGMATSILMYDLEIDIIDELLGLVPKDTLLYKGLKEYRVKLKMGFVTTFALENMTETGIKAIVEATSALVKEALGSTISCALLVKDCIKLTCTIIKKGFNLEDPNEYISSCIVGQFAQEMFQCVKQYGASLSNTVVSNDMIKYQKYFDYAIVASKVAIGEARKYAEHNEKFDENYIDRTLESYNSDSIYNEAMEHVKYTLSVYENRDIFESDFNPDVVYTITDSDFEILGPTDEIDVNKLYTYKDQIKGSITLNKSVLVIPKGMKVIVQGNLTASNESKITNNGTLIVNGNVSLNSSDLINNGTLQIQDELSVIESTVDNEKSMSAGKLSLKSDGDTYDRAGIFKCNNSTIINGDVNIGKASKITIDNKAVMHIKGNLNVRPGGGFFTSNYSNMIINDGVLKCSGNASAYKTYDIAGRGDIGTITLNSSNSVMYIGGNIVMEDRGSFTSGKGKVILNGSTVQEITNHDVYNLEVNNPYGIKLASDMYVYGLLNMNGNKIDSGKYKLNVEGTGKLSDGTRYGKVYINSNNYHINYNLICDSLELKFGRSYVVYIDKGVSVTTDSLVAGGDYFQKLINNGTLTVNSDYKMKHYYSLENYGTVNINGNMEIDTSSYNIGFVNYNNALITGSLTAVGSYHGKKLSLHTGSVLSVGGDISAYLSVADNDGTIILNGISKQTVDLEKYGILIIENDSSEGIAFTKPIAVSKLFNHNQKNYALTDVSKCTFTDYDGDGLNDNEDLYPLIKQNKKVPVVVPEKQDTPIVSVNTIDIKDFDNLLTKEEKLQLQNNANLSVSLDVYDVTNSITDEEKELIMQTSSNTGKSFAGMYLDISLYKKIGDNEAVKLTNLDNMVTISIKVPETLVIDSNIEEREYFIVRVHEGKAEIINGTFDLTSRTFTFSTNQFSTYALMYNDVNGNTDVDASDVKTDTDVLYLLLASAMGIIALMVGRKQRKQKIEN